MDLFPRIDLVTLPDNDRFPLADIKSSPEKTFLIVYDGNLPFLERVLAAAGYDDPGSQLHLIRREPGDEEKLDLAALLGELSVDKICLFGQDTAALGLHFNVSSYAPVSLAGRTYMVCDSVAHISGRKEQGDNTPSRALWGGIKQAFLREKNT